ncbi:O-acyltransferase (WSD1-like) family protein [Raphanus sativus]|nr:O-acyltransferase (WSD1-like) family protein [Raphanus sativus]
MAKKSKCRWGNLFGYIVLPFSVRLETDPLEYLRRAKVIVDHKKLSLEAVFSMAFFKLVLKFLGLKEEITFHGHPLSYIAPSVFGHPHALILHFQSYRNKVIISVTADPTVVPVPHKMCDDLVESLELIKSSVLERRLYKMEV